MALVSILAGAATAEKVPYRMDASNQAGWWKPIDERSGVTFVAYNAWGAASDGGAYDTHTVYVARRDPNGTWTRGCLKAAGTSTCVRYGDDIGHAQPTLAIDGDGHIHVFASMHHVDWRYWRSTVPGDPTTMVNRSATMPGAGTARITYPNTTRTPNGDVYLIVRSMNAGRLLRWNNSADTWTIATTFAADPEYTVYPDDVIADAAGNLHIAWEWAYGGSSGLRHLGSYARYEAATGRLTAASGAGLTAPVNHTTAAVIYQPLVAGEKSTDRSSPTNPPGFQSAKLTLDPATGRPKAAYRLRPAPNGHFEVRLAEWNGTGWTRLIVYAGKYTTYAAVDLTAQSGALRVYYAKTGVPEKNQAFHATRQPDGTWAETLILPGVPVERLAVVSRGGVDHAYLSTPTQYRLDVEVR
jgi:BNR repeat-containing family member